MFPVLGRKGTGWCLLCIFFSLLCRRNRKAGNEVCHSVIFKAGISMLLWFHSFTIAIHFVPISIGTGPFSGSGSLPGFWWFRGFTPHFRWLHHPHSEVPVSVQHPECCGRTTKCLQVSLIWTVLTEKIKYTCSVLNSRSTLVASPH